MAAPGISSGWMIDESVFGSAEMQAAIEALVQARLLRTKAGMRHVLGVLAVKAIATDPRMIAIASRFVGAAPVPFRATLFDKSSTANWLVVWHQDTALPLCERNEDAAWGPWSVKSDVLYAHAPAWALEQVIALRVQLDDSTLSNGPLRVLPGTHAHGVLTQDEIDRFVRDVPPVDCVTPSGGVVAMRPLLVHASSKAQDDRPRRVLHIEYASSSTLAPGIHLASA